MFVYPPKMNDSKIKNSFFATNARSGRGKREGEMLIFSE